MNVQIKQKKSNRDMTFKIPIKNQNIQLFAWCFSLISSYKIGKLCAYDFWILKNFINSLTVETSLNGNEIAGIDAKVIIDAHCTSRSAQNSVYAHMYFTYFLWFFFTFWNQNKWVNFLGILILFFQERKSVRVAKKKENENGCVCVGVRLSCDSSVCCMYIYCLDYIV